MIKIEHASPSGFNGLGYNVFCTHRNYQGVLDVRQIGEDGTVVLCLQPCWLLVESGDHMPFGPVIRDVRVPKNDWYTKPIIKTTHDVDAKGVYQMCLKLSAIGLPYTRMADARGLLVYPNELLVYGGARHDITWVVDRSVYARLLRIPYENIKKKTNNVTSK